MTVNIGGEGLIDLQDTKEGEYAGHSESEVERNVGIAEYFYISN